jgi:hypothetical protein
MQFKKYQHLERFATSEVQNIEIGTVYVFPKIDGTNASVWLDDEGHLAAGSRTRTLSLDADNAGFLAWAQQQEAILHYLRENPTHRLFGEWLVPHSLKTYRADAWRRFYVFDVAVDKREDEILHGGDDTVKYLPYDAYKPLLDAFGLDYINPLKVIKNGNYESFIHELQANCFLIEDGKGCGEGLVLKNYDFRNKFGRQTWAKIVTSEFKEKHAKEMGAPVHAERKMVEEAIANQYVTEALVEKVYAKIDNESGFTSRQIPQLLNTVYYDVVREDAWNFVKANKNPTINFSALQHFVFGRVKALKPTLF